MFVEDKNSNITINIYYNIGCNGNYWGGYETLEDAKKYALLARKREPDNHIFIKKEICIEEIIDFV